MLTLYVNPNRPYCIKTMKRAKELHSPIVIKSKEEKWVTEEVVEKGGTQQFPFLTDSENDTALYESEAIIAYLENYQKTH